MASDEPACQRILYLMRDAEYRATPATITGHDTQIRSYRMVIGERYNDEDGLYWKVAPPRSTPTTNRHIRALEMALARVGYVPDAGLAALHGQPVYVWPRAFRRSAR